jgi:photosynthetic reaction center cytochrome c subunit
VKFGSRRILLGTVAMAVVCLLGARLLAGQTQTEEKPLLAEAVFKNVQVLKGIPVNEFMGTMGYFSASLGLNCTFCHVAESLQDWQKFADDVPRKRTARRMILMVNAINKDNFGGRRAVTCYSCHRGGDRPKVIPSLAEQYSTPMEDPNEIELVAGLPPGPSADQILDKYLQTIGGIQRVSALTSFVAKGTYEGFETYHLKVPVEIFAKAPGQLTTVVHTQNGDSTTTFDGRAGWVAAADKPVPLLALTAGAELDGAKLDAELLFPARIKETLSQWRVGFPVTAIDDRDVRIVQGTGPGKTRIKLYFDEETGLLTRQVRYAETMVGINPTQIDYSDYREVAGVKIPFHWTVTWTNGQSRTELSEIQANAPVDPVKFAKPAPAAVTPAKQ